MTARTFVLLHGAFHGGWCWARVAERLRGEGHRVTTPTQTGLGERKHLMSPDITLETFITDLTNHIEAEELADVVLVGHSFGGCAISGAADRMPDRIRHLVYLDSRILEDGMTAAEASPPAVWEERRRNAETSSAGLSIPPPPAASFGVPDGPDAEWVNRRLTPHPMGTWTSRFRLQNPIGNGRPCTYIFCNDPVYASLENSRQWVRGQSHWHWREIATGHNAMVTAPEDLARMLVDIAA